MPFTLMMHCPGWRPAAAATVPVEWRGLALISKQVHDETGSRNTRSSNKKPLFTNCAQIQDKLCCLLIFTSLLPVFSSSTGPRGNVLCRGGKLLICSGQGRDTDYRRILKFSAIMGERKKRLNSPPIFDYSALKLYQP